METAIPMLFSFWMCVIYIIFSVIMIGIWICVGIMGGPSGRLKQPKAPEPPPPPNFDMDLTGSKDYIEVSTEDIEVGYYDWMQQI